MKKRCLAILAVWLMLLSAACDQLDPMAMPGLEGDRPSAGIDWFYCGDTFECGHLRVPADYRDPARGSLRFPLIVHRAPSPEERRGYLFVNPGGPGVSGIAYLEQALPELPGELVEHFDLVGFDPRGVGYAEPTFACGAPGEQYALLAAIEMPIDTPQEFLIGEAAARLCLESMGPVGGRLHTEFVAREMDEIRQALSAEQISYWGAGYGATLGVWYATLFPDAVRAMVVDSAADNPASPADTPEERLQEAMERLGPLEAGLTAALRACDNPQECPIYHDGNPEGYFRQAATKLALVDSAAGHRQAGPLGVISTLYNPAGRPALWHGLFELQEHDDPSILLELALRQIGKPGAASLTAHINCLDSWVLAPLDRPTMLAEAETLMALIEDQFPLLAALSLQAPDTCVFYDPFAPDSFAGALDGGDVPILVVRNRADAITPFSQSEELVTEALGNGYLVETSHADHVVYPNNQCVNGHVHRALVERVFPAERRVLCEEEAIPLAAEQRELSRVESWTEDCISNIDCLVVTVPADYQDPEAGTVALVLTVHKATSPEERIGYLFMNPGGPGASAADLVAATPYVKLFSEEIVERFDIVGMDPRGVGYSVPAFACVAPGDLYTRLAAIEPPLDTAAKIAAGQAAAYLCLESMGPVGGRLHTEYVVRDMDEIRQLLGADQITYLGFSYGSMIGVWYATLFPQSTRAMVVDGARNPRAKAAGPPSVEEQIGALDNILQPREAALEAALQACDDPTTCPIYHDGDPVGYFLQAVSKLGLADRTVGHPQAGYMGIISPLYDETQWPDLWRGLFELQEHDDPSVLLELGRRQLQGKEYGEVTVTAHINCLDQWVLEPELLASRSQLPDDPASEEGEDATYYEYPPLHSAIFATTLSLPEQCNFYGPFAPEPFAGTLDGSDTPILVVGNYLDVTTPFVDLEALATETLSNGYLVETAHYKHVVYNENSCVNALVDRVLLDRVFPDERRVVCEREDPPAPA